MTSGPGPDRADPELGRLLRTRRLIAAQVAGALAGGIALAGALAYRTTIGAPPGAAARPDPVAAAERRRLLRALAVAEVAGVPAGLLLGWILARRSIAPLDEMLARRRHFVADVSHELRAPLTRLHTRAQLVARRLDGRNPALLAQDVDLLVTGTRQLADVVDDLLLSAQVRQARRPSRRVDLSALATELAAAEVPRAAARGVTIEIRRHGPGDHVVCGVEPALRRVISALLDNALGHARAGGHIWVMLSGGPGATVELTVRDDGVGLDPRDAARLFTRFVRGERGEHRGFGLGLALVREVVADHGGTVAVAGRPGGGAAFTVRLPAAPAAGLDVVGRGGASLPLL